MHRLKNRLLRRNKINALYDLIFSKETNQVQIVFFLDTSLACVAGIIGEGEGERGSREKMRGTGERGEGTPATRTPFDSFPPNDFRLIKLPYPSITVISSTNQNKARVSLHD